MNRPSNRPAPLDEVTRRHRDRNRAHAVALGEQESVHVSQLAGVLAADNDRRERRSDVAQAREELLSAFGKVLDACEEGVPIASVRSNLEMLFEAVEELHRSAACSTNLDAMYRAIARMERASDRSRVTSPRPTEGSGGR